MKKKEINDRLLKIENEVKEIRNELVNKEMNNEEWIDKILEVLSDLISRNDHYTCEAILKKWGNIVEWNPIYKHFSLSLIIQAVADLLNEELIDWKNFTQIKYYFYYHNKNNAINICDNTYNNSGVIYFTKNAIEKAKEILTNLNGLNILKMYFGIE